VQRVEILKISISGIGNDNASLEPGTCFLNSLLASVYQTEAKDCVQSNGKEISV
jgi:hypothetical protein